MIKVLFSSAGRRVALINCFRNAARDLDVSLEVVAVDMDPAWSPACQVADRAFKVERCTSPDFAPQVLELCVRHDISLVVPTIDTELVVFAENRALFAESGVGVHIGARETVEVTRDKAATASALNRHGVQVPSTWSVEDVVSGTCKPDLPLLVKPKRGSCSKGVSVVSSVREIERIAEIPDEWVVQELCRGQEYTANCFYDPHGEFVACVPHSRRFVRDGEVCFAETERIHAFKEIAREIPRIFPGILGAICFQGFKQADGRVRVFEINARFGGGYPVCDAAGGTFARWILQELMGVMPDYHDNWKEGVRMLRYDDAVFTGV